MDKETNMTKIDKIHREITQRVELLKGGIAHPEVMKRVEGALQAYESILAFIDTLQEQEPELDNEIEEYINGCLGSLTGQEIASCARYFYNLGKQDKVELPQGLDEAAKEESWKESAVDTRYLWGAHEDLYVRDSLINMFKAGAEWMLNKMK